MGSGDETSTIVSSPLCRSVHWQPSSEVEEEHVEGAQPGYDQEERKGEEETGIQIAVECGPSLHTLIPHPTVHGREERPSGSCSYSAVRFSCKHFIFLYISVYYNFLLKDGDLIQARSSLVPRPPPTRRGFDDNID